MKGIPVLATPLKTELPGLPPRRAGALSRFATLARCSTFWWVQGMVAAISLAYYYLEYAYHTESLSHLHYMAPILFAVPIVVSSVRFGYPVALATALEVVVIGMPCVLHAWSESRVEAITEVVELGVGLVVGLVVAWLMERQIAERRRAEEMAGHLARLHRRVTQAQEEERRRIARELHDVTAQSMVVLCRGLDEVATAPRLPEAARRSLQQMRMIAENTLAGLRRFSRDLRPSVLDDLGLVPAVQWLAAELGKRGATNATVMVEGAPSRLPPDSELALFRIAQEALRNVEKHSGASTATVWLAFASDRVRLRISDDGQGFEVPASLNNLVPQSKLGLVGMRERAELLGATFELVSAPGKGTCVTVTLDQTKAVPSLPGTAAV